MITKINCIDELDGYGKTDLYSVRIMSLASAYGTAYDFATFYRQICGGKITAIISRLDGDITVSCDNADLEEISEFVRIIGFASCLCGEKLSLDCSCTDGVVMSADKKCEFALPGAVIDEYPKLMDIYNFDDYGNTDFEAWYVDASHRIRHGAAAAYTLSIGGRIAASALFSSIYNNNAVLTAVRTLPEFRRRGCGTALVSHMLCDVKGTVFLMRENGRNECFYSRMGFSNIGKWRMYK